MLRVHIDSLAPEGASGWVCDPSAPGRRLTLEALVDGRPVASVRADSFRPDLRRLGLGDGYAGFRLAFPEGCFDGREHDVLLRVGETGRAVTEGPVRLRFPGRAPGGGRPQGHFEGVDGALVASGWAWMPGEEEPPCVTVLLDGKPVAEERTRIVRPDLGVVGLHGRRAGFRIPIPAEAVARLEGEVSVAVAGHGLPGGPQPLRPGAGTRVCVEGVRAGAAEISAEGWPGDRLEGRVLIDGRDAGAIVLAREGDVHRGRFPLPASLRDGQPHVLAFERRDGRAALRSDPAIFRDPDYRVNVDTAARDALSGWAVRADSAVPLRLALEGPGGTLAECTADLARPDVRKAWGLDTERCGFHVALPPGAVPEGEGACLELRDRDTGTLLAEIAMADRHEALAATARAAGLGAVAGLRATLAPLAAGAADTLDVAVRRLPPAPRRASPGRATVVIPVHGGPLETAECLASVLAARTEARLSIVIVSDAPPDRMIRDLVDRVEAEGRGDVRVIRREVNGGFTEAVNLGMIAAGAEDVILLNADTVVQDGWADRLLAAAARDPMIGTVTPLSNNGEIVTAPYPCTSLPVDDPALARAVDAAAARVNEGVVVDLPVAVGFCMLIRRACLDSVGLFDVATWGRGYGEEVDFCLKARALGWRHVAAADAFVVHRGSVSFGDEKRERILESARKIAERYPFYDGLVQRFIAADPLAPARRAIDLALIKEALEGERILHVSHDFGGGTERHLRAAAAAERAAGAAPLVLRFAASGEARLEIALPDTPLAGLYADRHALRYRAGEAAALEADLAGLGIARVRLHGPVGVPPGMLKWLRARFPLEVTVHDYAWICPRVTLTRSGGEYCGEPAAAACAACVAVDGAHPGTRALLDAAGGDVAAYRAELLGLLNDAAAVRTGVHDVAERLARHGVSRAVDVIPHADDETAPTGNAPAPPPLVPGERVRVALFGALSEIKGHRLLLACARHAEEAGLALGFIVFGHTQDDAAYAGLGNVTITGRYQEEALDALVARFRPHVSFFPGGAPETYSYTLSHAMRLGLPAAVRDIGALAERVRVARAGVVLPLDAEPPEICRALGELAAGAHPGHAA